MINYETSMISRALRFTGSFKINFWSLLVFPFILALFPIFFPCFFNDAISHFYFMLINTSEECYLSYNHKTEDLSWITDVKLNFYPPEVFSVGVCWYRIFRIHLTDQWAETCPFRDVTGAPYAQHLSHK